MKVDRLIGILTLLLQREKITAPELAQRFEVSRRTINRDIETLCQAGIPLITTQGQGGGIALAAEYKLNHTLLTPPELAAIAAGLKGLDSVTPTGATAALWDKLSLSPASAQTTNNAIIIDLSSHYQDSLSPKIQLIKQAIETQKRITFTYYSSQGEGQRCIEPYHLVFQWSDWYVFGYCLDRQDFRLFKLNRLWDVMLTETDFIRRPVVAERLDFANYFTHSPLIFKGLFASSARYRLIEEYGPQSFTVQPDGRLLFTDSFRSLTYLLSWVLSFGGQVKVLAPDELIEQLSDAAHKILEQHFQT